MAFGEGSGGSGGNILWKIIWFLILIFLGFWIAGFCAGFYILFVPFTVCISGLKGFTDFLLKGVDFSYFCAKHMMSGTPLGDAFK